MSRKKREVCFESGCMSPAVFRGRCEEHYREYREEQSKREHASYMIRHGHDGHGKTLQDPTLREEFGHLTRWWHRACDRLNFKRPDAVFVDERDAEAALTWCINLTAYLIEADAEIAAGHEVSHYTKSYSDWVWGNFKNLEAGLMSNGIKRPDQR